MVVDEFGNKTDCFAYVRATKRKAASCKVLKKWYHGVQNDRCEGCPFYKTKAQLEAETEGDEYAKFY